jgi:hypothetical protein
MLVQYVKLFKIDVVCLRKISFLYVIIEAVPRGGKADKKQPEYWQPSSHVRNVVRVCHHNFLLRVPDP